MKRVVAYRRGNASNWITMPSLPYKSLILFILLGTYSFLSVEDEEGRTTIRQRLDTDEREKLLSLLA